MTIDESMVGSKARCSMIQYIPSKPTRYGFKVWVLADSITGYIIEFELYQGQEDGTTDDNESDNDSENDPHDDGKIVTQDGDPPTDVERLVLRLCQALPEERNFNVFADSLFCSVRVAKQLSRLGHNLCGTIKLNSVQLPPSLTQASCLLDPGESISTTHSKEDVAVFVKRSKKKFGIVSTLHSPAKDSIDGVRDEYNRKARGVDLANQRLACYQPQRQTLRWWHTLFDFMLNVSVCNAYVLFSSRSSPSLSELKFRLAVVSQIFQIFAPNKILATPINHHLPRRGAKSNTCRQCTKYKKHGRSIYYCPGCSTGAFNIHLHPKCFEAYHKK